MKTVICLLAICASANSGYIFEGGPAMSYGGRYVPGSFGFGENYGGHQESIVRVIHESSDLAPSVRYVEGPSIVKVIHEEDHHHHHHKYQHVETVPQLVNALHEEHALFEAAPGIEHVNSVHGYGHVGGISYGVDAPEVRIIKVIQPEAEFHHIKPIHESHEW